MEKKRIVGYSRIGMGSQDFSSVFDKHLREMIGKRDDCEYVGFYVDYGVSGISKKSLAFANMLRDAEQHKFDYIIVKSIDRLSRDKSIALNAIQRMTECGVGVFFEKENIGTWSDDFKSLMNILTKLSEEENRLKNLLLNQQNKLK